MASVTEGSNKDATHALAFRVMRLTRPALKVEMPLKCDANDLWHGEDDFSTPILSKGGDPLFAARSELSEPLDACGVSGMMVLPQAFGSIYLGETLCSYISVGNHSKHDVSHLTIKAELQTERQKVVLTDTSKSAIEVLPAGGRHDFIIEHDIKELGSHTLVCSAVYYLGTDQKYVPQYFTFVASNPLSVRTKVRTVKGGVQDNTFLEACVENSTKAPLFLEHIRLDVNPLWTVSPLEPPTEEGRVADEQLSGLFRQPNVIGPNGGSKHFLYTLTRVPLSVDYPIPTPTPTYPPTPIQGSNTLGKLEILWRTVLGEAGRLQTQQILGNPTARKEVELRVVNVPPHIVVERPFMLECRLSNCTERVVGPFSVAMNAEEGGGARTLVASGPWAITVPELSPHATTNFSLCLVALAWGVQKLSGVSVQDARDGKPYDTLPPTEGNKLTRRARYLPRYLDHIR